MQLAQYLMCIANRHELAKAEHEQELKEMRLKKKGKGKSSSVLTYKDETALLKGVIGLVRGKPKCLKKLTLPALGCLAYILTAKIENEHFVEGHEIVSKLVSDPEKTIEYLLGIHELRDQGWIQMIARPGVAFFDQPPFCWLQAYLELGDTFHKELGANQFSRAFTSNDTYLDAVFAYLQTIIRDDTSLYQVIDSEADLSIIEPVRVDMVIEGGSYLLIEGSLLALI
jgi:hypothetical protein